MTDVDPRLVLDRLIRERREDYSNLSRLLGRNPAYIQQFIKRGSPKRLNERDQRTLARYLNVSEQLLGGASKLAEEAAGGLVTIPQLDVDASAGPGALDGTELPISYMAFDRKWLRRLGCETPEHLSIIRVQGDSMFPTLTDGDDIMVDRSGSSRLSDGIYVLRRDDTLVVKRLAISPATRRINVSSDNAAYPAWADCDPQSIDIVGRVVWAGRKIG